jgi:uncharacterized protein (TIGR02145 family)
MHNYQIRFSIYIFILTGILLFTIDSCKKESNPVLTTTAVIYITQTTATCGGNITGDGGAAVIARGVCWGINQTPTIADNKTANGTGTGSFTSVITGLTANTTYYERAFATNSAGTAYGSVVSFTTPGTLTDIDGNVYNTVVIGTQVWMAENLKTTRYRNGDPIRYISDSTQWNIYLATGAYCTYRNDNSYANIYGHLYNWYAVNNNRKIAPSGWHIPSNDEWTTLTTFLGGFLVAGGKLKEAGTTHWASPNTGATNETGFTALPGGYRDGYEGMFEYLKTYLYMWSSTSADNSKGWCRFMDNEGIIESEFVFEKIFGFSVRCMKD